MNECYCDNDGEPNEFYAPAQRIARRAHRCGECFHPIVAGERYEHVAAKSDGSVWTAKTCSRCYALREWVQAHVPCFCWAHGSVIELADDTIREYRHELAGMGMAYGRLRVAATGPRGSASRRSPT